MENGEAKELIYMAHGYELRSGNDGGWEGTWWSRIMGRINVGQL